ncbi:Lactate utilization protein C [Fundidesulfovibrio magnetotacticus]|uniref:Lactate utilization protein C n=1 Tax=Fundidesulfovibrio magnetotacticus TaxID=2730080 RepID=A0A6V8LQN6_9BACT|nr:LUD domain-containing protein [Fundidesulfovibrio magnetotacticus]GFK92871.1 Lactate utilization protein C [Fundidesulfovibrio magnetotacticus]
MDSAIAREAILARLSRNRPAAPAPVAPDRAWSPPRPGRHEAVDLLCARMAAVKTEVIRTSAAQMADALADLLAAKAPSSLAYGPASGVAPLVREVLARPGMPSPLPVDRPVEELRDALFAVDASVTGVRLAIAENGSLLLTPDATESRLLSLVPPLHIAVLFESQVRATFADALAELAEAGPLPPNALLISGPSKTADIELTLTFGVHGPKELAVLVVSGVAP